MVIRYQYINFFSFIINTIPYYKYFLSTTIVQLNGFITNFNFIKRKKIVYYFRYFFWLFFINSLCNIQALYIYYKYFMQYLLILLYLQNKNIKFYNIFYVNNSVKIQKKMEYFIMSMRKPKLIFIFRSNNGNYCKLPQINTKTFEVVIHNPDYYFFFFYINYLL